MLLLLLVTLLVTVSVAEAGSDWITYENSRLRAERYFDGDSFSVKTTDGTRSYTYIFRLYGVDCAETDLRFPERIAAQARDFKITEDEVVGWGMEARRFTEAFLGAPFTVLTRKSKARGSSGQNRYYAIVVDGKGSDLGEALVRAGLARAFGFWPELTPEDRSGQRYRMKLERLEAQARADGVGLWARERKGKEPKGFFRSKLPFQ